MINKEGIEKYVRELFGDEVLNVKIEKLGEGVQGAGFLIEVDTKKGVKPYVIKGLFPEGLEHDYAADRAQVFLLDLQDFKELPKHVKALDVLAEMEDGSIRSIGGGKEYYLLMEKAEGDHYFNDLAAMADKESLDPADKDKTRRSLRMQHGPGKVVKIEQQNVAQPPSAVFLLHSRGRLCHMSCLNRMFASLPSDC